MARNVVATLWANRDRVPAADDEAARLLAVLEQHPEYHSIWDQASELEGEVLVDGANPFVHAQLHLIVENQIAEDNPTEVAQALRSLEKSGADRHEAIHKIAHILVGLMYPLLSEDVEFDTAEYKRQLRKL